MKNKLKEHPRFWSKVDASGDCWLWTATRQGSGYGWYALDGGNGGIASHRFAYTVQNGKIPEGLYVCHKCDVRICVNPSHLFLGTAYDNSQDMFRKGRATVGEKHSNSKLSEKDIIQIREIYKSGEMNQIELAKKFKTVQSRISRIVNRSTWRHLP
jgi:predicted XRE-type DNA-binding protein